MNVVLPGSPKRGMCGGDGGQCRGGGDSGRIVIVAELFVEILVAAVIGGGWNMLGVGVQSSIWEVLVVVGAIGTGSEEGSGEGTKAGWRFR